MVLVWYLVFLWYGKFILILSGGEMTLKYDKDKPRWSLLPFKEAEEVVDVLTIGAKKYADDNWKTVPDRQDRYFSACLRHMTAWKIGELIDKETGRSHLAHAVCCLLFMMWGDNNESNKKA